MEWDGMECIEIGMKQNRNWNRPPSVSNQEQVILNTKKKVSEELNMMSPEELRVYASNIEFLGEMNRNHLQFQY